MSLRYALLALLNVEPMTGYDLFKDSRPRWHVGTRRLADLPGIAADGSRGATRGRGNPLGARGKKRQYHVTEAGLWPSKTG